MPRGTDPAALAVKFDVRERSFALTPAAIQVAEPSAIRVTLIIACQAGPVYITTKTGNALLPQGIPIDTNSDERFFLARDGGLTQIAWNAFSQGPGGTVTVFEVFYWKDR